MAALHPGTGLSYSSLIPGLCGAISIIIITSLGVQEGGGSGGGSGGEPLCYTGRSRRDNTCLQSFKQLFDSGGRGNLQQKFKLNAI